MKQLDFMDTIFLSLEKKNSPMHIGTLNIYDMGTSPNKIVRFKEVLNAFSATLPATPIYRRKLKHVPLGLDRPYWIDDDKFDLEYHVRHLALPKPGDWRQLCILVSRIYSRQLDMTKPPWECYVIEGLDSVEGIPKGSFAMLFKYHHSAFDGKSAYDALYSSLHSDSPDSKNVYFDNFEITEPPSATELLIRASSNLTRSPFLLASGLKSILSERSSKSPKNKQAKMKPTLFNDSISPNRAFLSEKFPITGLKEIREKVDGATINDVVLTIISLSLEKYLRVIKKLGVDLIAGVPVSIRSEHDSSGGNLVRLINVALRTDISDPISRLKSIHEYVSEQKEVNNSVRVRKQMKTIDHLPAAMLSLGIKAITKDIIFNRINPPFNTIITNVPGPRNEMYFCGAKQVELIGLGCPVNNMGLFHTVTSYNNWLRITPLACRDMLSDPGLYARFLNESYTELLKSKPGKRKNKQLADGVCASA